MPHYRGTSTEVSDCPSSLSAFFGQISGLTCSASRGIDLLEMKTSL